MQAARHMDDPQGAYMRSVASAPAARRAGRPPGKHASRKASMRAAKRVCDPQGAYARYVVSAHSARGARNPPGEHVSRKASMRAAKRVCNPQGEYARCVVSAQSARGARTPPGKHARRKVSTRQKRASTASAAEVGVYSQRQLCRKAKPTPEAPCCPVQRGVQEAASRQRRTAEVATEGSATSPSSATARPQASGRSSIVARCSSRGTPRQGRLALVVGWMDRRSAGGEVICRCRAARHDAALVDALIYQCRRVRCPESGISGASHVDASALLGEWIETAKALAALRAGRDELPLRLSDAPLGPVLMIRPGDYDESFETGAALNKRLTPSPALACRAA
jgi:hypothetical protein